MVAHHDASLPVCVRCGRPVRVNADQYQVLERMHWVCFHDEFEHEAGVADGDPDQACRDPECPARAFDPNPAARWA